MNIRELIDSIESGKTLDIEATFESIMADKVSSRLGSMRHDLATTMFSNSNVEEETYISQEEFDALSEEEQNEYDLVEEKDEDDKEDDEGDKEDDDEDDKEDDEDDEESEKSKK
jgi:phosphopantothenoylcysteine synthetase/decarboxylase